jgi:hypothetical protein
MATGYDEPGSGLDFGLERIKMIAGEVNDIFHLGPKPIGDRLKVVPILPLIVDAIHRKDVQLLSRLQQVGVIVQYIVVTPQHGLGLDAEMFGYTEHGVTDLDRVPDDFHARALGDNRVEIDAPRDI